jgi:hypothetical protein
MEHTGELFCDVMKHVSQLKPKRLHAVTVAAYSRRLNVWQKLVARVFGVVGFVALFAWSRCAVKLRTLRSTNIIAHDDACQLTRKPQSSIGYGWRGEKRKRV